MANYEGKLAGILGAVIIHLAAAIVFMLFQLKTLNSNHSEEFIVEFQTVKESDDQKDLIELPASGIESILQGNEEYLNIARNLANQPAEQVDPEDYIDMVKEELIQSGLLGRDNYIDEQKKMKETTGEESVAIEMIPDEKADEKPKTSQEMAANYQGPTRIYYDLAGRTHAYLPIPIYKCEGSGIVILLIHVNQKGVVEQASIIEGQSTTTDPCLSETAVSTALVSRFNSDINSPKIQTGTLTYQFVAQ